MHSKAKGNIGECAVALDLMKRGYPVFTEMGDLSKTDLITIIDNTPIKIQVKNHKCNDKRPGVIMCSLLKSGPNYSFKYGKDDLDLFAYYIEPKDVVIYLNWNDFANVTKVLNIRYIPAKNGNKKMINWFEDYTDFNRALKGV